ncbi:MAG: DsbA family oxidoreductase [Streptosporangiaceae bacterium]
MKVEEVKVEVFRDFACAWSRLGTRRFELATAEAGLSGSVELVHRPFLLNPDIPADVEPRPLLDVMGARFGGRERAESMLSSIVPFGLRDGVEYNFDKTLAVSSVHSHRLMWLAARDHDNATQNALAVAIYDAYFRDGRNIADRAELASLAAGVGIDRAKAATFLDSDEAIAEIREQAAAARANGVTTVPTFVFPGGETLPGASETDALTQALRNVEN